jgi:hypothetical protein
MELLSPRALRKLACWPGAGARSEGGSPVAAAAVSAPAAAPAAAPAEAPARAEAPDAAPASAPPSSPAAPASAPPPLLSGKSARMSATPHLRTFLAGSKTGAGADAPAAPTGASSGTSRKSLPRSPTAAAGAAATMAMALSGPASVLHTPAASGPAASAAGGGPVILFKLGDAPRAEEDKDTPSQPPSEPDNASVAPDEPSHRGSE